MYSAVGVIGAVMTAIPALCRGVGTYITLPENFITDCLAYVGTLFTDASLLIILAIGLPLGFWVIHKVIALARAR